MRQAAFVDLQTGLRIGGAQGGGDGLGMTGLHPVMGPRPVLTPQAVSPGKSPVQS